MSEHTQMKGAGKSRHLPIGTPGSCLTEDDRHMVVDSIDMSGPECRRCRVPVPQRQVVNLEFTVSTTNPASVLDLARSQAATAFGCIDEDPALVVTVGTGLPTHEEQSRHGGDWSFTVSASWDAEIGTLEHTDAHERRRKLERRNLPDRRR